MRLRGGEVDLNVDGGLGDDRVDARSDDSRDLGENLLNGLRLPAELGQVVAVDADDEVVPAAGLVEQGLAVVGDMRGEPW